MSVLGDIYLRRLLAASNEEEFEIEVRSVIEQINGYYEGSLLSKREVDELIDELVKRLLERGYSKRSLSFEEYGGLEDLHKSLSIDNSKSDDLLTLAYPSSKKTAKPKR
ncbi:TPA: hypothetical protein ACF3I9_004455 [Klebsiella aerogenes]